VNRESYLSGWEAVEESNERGSSDNSDYLSGWEGGLAPALLSQPTAVRVALDPQILIRLAISELRTLTAWQTIIEIALHFPAAQIELPPRATIQTAAIRLTTIGERPAHFFVPTAEHASEPTANGCARSGVNLNIRKPTCRGLLNHSREPL
jgi:hypothetical protein